MKNLTAIILISLFAILCCVSCTEKGPVINLGDTSFEGDTTYVVTDVPTAQQKNVLIDEFTGVRCVNCPDGHALVKSLQEANPGRVIAISWHSNLLGQPFPQSSQDLKIPEAQQIEDLLGGLQGKPSACIDRVMFSGESQRLILMPKWAGYTNDRLQENTPVNIEITTDYTSSTNLLKIQLTLSYTDLVSTANRLSIVLAENNIIEPQVTPDGIVNDYLHQHVARKILTPLSGRDIPYEKIPGRTVVFQYETELDPLWKAEEISIVAIIHQPAPNHTVYHTVKKNILE